MTAPNVRSTVEGVLDEHVVRIRRLEAARGGGLSIGPWIAPTFVNGWANAGVPFDDVAYRLTPISLEFKGHCTGGASGTIAFYLLAAYWPAFDLSTITDTVTPSTPGAAEIYVFSVDGGVRITTII